MISVKSNVGLSIWVAELVKCIQRLSHIARKLADISDKEIAERCFELSVFSLKIEKEIDERVKELVKEFTKED